MFAYVNIPVQVIVGIINDKKIDNDLSIETLTNIAVSQAKVGVDVVSPSAMMDGQVSAIRKGLDDANFKDVIIMSHSAKHSSSFYSPFRDAAECAPQFGDRKTYQVPFTNPREAMREVEADVEEGVDIVMIKPALSYLDLIAEAKKRFNIPVSAYSVSGEYAMVKAAANQGWIKEDQIINEILSSIKRAGADFIVTYFAKSGAKLISDNFMIDYQRFEIQSAFDLLPHVVGCSWATIWFRLNKIKNPTREEF